MSGCISGMEVQSTHFPRLSLGRCLGPMKNEGNEIGQAILKQNGTIVPRRSIRALNPEELAITNETEARKRLAFDANIRIKIGDSFSLPNVSKFHKTESNAYEQHFPMIIPLIHSLVCKNSSFL